MGSNLIGGSRRGLRDSGFPAASQVLPFGYSEAILPLIRRFCSETAERLPNSRVDGEISGQDPAGLPDSDLDCDDVPSRMSGMIDLFKKPPETKHKVTQRNRYLFQIVLDAPSDSLRTTLDMWIQDGNRLERSEALLVLFHLRKQRLYRKALQFVEWMEMGKLLNFEECDYACHLDLIARNHGIESAQKYIKRVPQSFRNVVLYETLLVNCVCIGDMQKAEEVFKEIKDSNLPLTVSSCNQMILLYKRIARRKVVDILILMEKKNIKPSFFTYKLLIDLKGRSNDAAGMEKVLNEMKARGLEPDIATQSIVAKFYIDWDLTEKAEAILKEMEVQFIKDKHHAIRSLLYLYAALNKPDDVARVWKLRTESNLEDFLAAINAWGKLGHIEQAEETFEELLKTTPKLSSKFYNAMLNVYSENKLVAKGKKFVEKMSLDGCPDGPLTWDALIRLYVNSGEVEKADSFLLNVTEENPERRPIYSSYIFLLKAYAKRGDIHNAEKIFDRLKKIAYPGRAPPYAVLLEAYVNGKVVPHGFMERMRADNVRPIKKVYTDLKFLNTLQEKATTELVD